MIPFPKQTFKMIMADPPWEYESVKSGGSMTSGAAQKYPTMSLERLCKLPVKKIVDKSGCALLLWVTTPLKYDIATSGLLEKWGFEYKTTVYWRKLGKLGTGYWFRGEVEECWLCIHGKVEPFHLQIPNIIQTKVGEHSAKPKEIRRILNEVSQKFNLNPKIELFARDRIEGWACWGNETPTSEQKLLGGIDNDAYTTQLQSAEPAEDT
jgi:site-specific DNA-methyltransferase (adenine-specific)